MLKMCVDEAVRMVLGAFMLMDVLKGRLQERQRQHEVHKNGNAGSHRHILLTYHSQYASSLCAQSDRPKSSEERVAEEVVDLGLTMLAIFTKASGNCFLSLDR